jgi:ubiquinone/menaquinone biosynthesis C-methylase UbiE
MPSDTQNYRVSHHDWHSPGYVDEWIAKDVTRDDERRPLLQKMLASAPYAHDAAIDVLDVGAGYGIVTEELLKVFPSARVVLQDYSKPMSEKARARFAKGSRQLKYVLCDLIDPSWPKKVGGPFDLAVSAIAIHNLGDRAKIFACYGAIHDLLKPGGVFLNYDRFPGGTDPHLKALRDAGFKRLETTYEKAPIAIVVAER